MDVPPPYTLESASSSAATAAAAPAPPAWRAAPEESLYHGVKRDAAFEDFQEGIDFCLRNPVYSPLSIDKELQNHIKERGLGAYSFTGNPFFHGTITEEDGQIVIITDDAQLDCSISSTLPILFANSPATTFNAGIYFEVTIHSLSLRKHFKKIEGIVSIGAGCLPYPGFRQVGWNRGSVGVHSDDGNKFFEDGYGGRGYTRPFKEKDIIGIRINHAHNGPIEYFINGHSCGPAFEGIWFPRHQMDIYAMLGFEGPVKVSINFGAREFKYSPGQGYSILQHYIKN